MPAAVSVEMLAEIVQSVFVTMMDLEVSPGEMEWKPAGDRLTSSVQLTGEWNGAVLLECSRHQACQFAGRILAMDPPEAVDDDVRDVIGELANMIGGNMKSGMANGIRLSMPAVTDGDYDLRVVGSHVEDRLSFQCADGHFWVSVLSKETEPAVN